MVSFFRSLDNLSREASATKNKELFSFCSEVKMYIQSGEFTKYKRACDLLSCWGMSDIEASLMTGMKESTVRVARRNLSNELYGKLGYDYITLLSDQSQKSLKEGKTRLAFAKDFSSADSFVPLYLMNKIKLEGSLGKSYDVKDCADEIRFLVKFSKQNMDREIKDMDKDKLMYLIRLLNGEDGLPTDAYNLISLFTKVGG